MKRIVIACAALGLASPLLMPVPASAQSPDYLTNDRCWRAVVHEARGRFAAREIVQVSSNIVPGPNVENILQGSGEANGRPFRYSCTYNLRTGHTYGVSVRPEPVRVSWPLPGGSWGASCTQPEMRGPVLVAQCRGVGGGWYGSSIDMRACPSGRVANANGNLVCS